jgi:hypothetical protein
MDDNQQVVNQSGEAETPASSATTDVNQTATEEATEQATSEVQPESDRASKRYQELANENKALKEKLEGTSQKVTRAEEQDNFVSALDTPNSAVSAQPAQQLNQGLPWETQTPKEEITLDDYKRDVTLTADAIVQSRVAALEAKQAKVDEIRGDYQKVVSKWDNLDPESSSFDPNLSKGIGKLFKDGLMRDKNIKLYDFTNSIMELRESGREQGKSEVTERLVQQKAEEAITPSAQGGDEPNVADVFSDPTKISEQEAILKKQGLWE